MYIILSPNSTTIFGWWKIEKKLKVFGLDTLEQPPHQSYSSSEPWTIIHCHNYISFKEPIFDGKIPSFDGQTTTNSQ